jgi:predicted aspartyl protease
MRCIIRTFALAVLVAAGTPAIGADEAADAPLAPSTPAEAPADCPLTVYAKLDMIDLDNGLVAIPVKLEGNDLYFMIDTGGFINTINADVVDRLKLERHAAGAKVLGIGQSMDSYVVPKSFAMGPMSGNDMHFYVEPISVPGLSGSLAPDTMRKFDVDFDFAGGKFGIFSSDHCPGKVVYWTKAAPIAAVPAQIDDNGHVLVAATLEGHAVTAVLDTGSNTTILSFSAARRLLGIDETSPGLVERDRNINGARHKTYSYPVKLLTIQEVTMANPSILILEDSDMLPLGTDLVLGMNILRRMHIYIAYQEGKIYLTPAGAH